MREGGGCVEGGKGIYKNSGGLWGGAVFRQGYDEGRSGKPGVWGGLVTTEGGCIVVGEDEDQTRPSGGMHGTQ
jgi:hypothetical protein